PSSVTAVDVNGDGKPDLAAAAPNGNTIDVLLATTPAPTTIFGTGAYAVQQTFSTGTQPAAAVVADVNGDGKPDLITANQGDGKVSVLLDTTTPGATVPAYATKQDFGAGTDPVSVASGDLTGDGKPDLVVANENAALVTVLVNGTATNSSTASYSSA